MKSSRPFQVILVALALAVLVYGRISEKSLASKVGKQAVEQGATPVSLAEKLERVQTLAEELQKMPPQQRVAELQANPEKYVGLVLIGLGTMLVLFVGLIGVGVLIWLIVVHRSGRPLIPQAEAPEPRWDLWDFGTAFALFVLIHPVLALIFGTGPYGLVTILILRLLIACGVGAAIVRHYGQTLAAVGVHARDFWRNIARGLVGYVANLPIFAAVALIMQLTIRLVGRDMIPPNPVIDILMGQSAPVAILLALSAGVIVPIGEEFLFRGLLYGALRKRMRATWAIIISAALFAVIHMQITHFLPIFVLGVAMAYLYERTRSLVPSTILHIAHNSMSMIAILILKYGV